ncbi:MAG: cyclic beta 1-2 glucan synthetase, partial [Lentisphaerae bacterium]|nr:cyclic beta 1-2 glucan synthetase [Lentisphaerota bacterium]
NGGQYTHAAIWTAMAFAELGDAETAWQLFDLLNPVNHSLTPATAARYRVEPYVMTADIYSVAPHTGRGGWSWYTGAAGWMYRLAVETLLGFERHPDHLRINPRLPSIGLDHFRLTYRFRSATYHIEVRRAPAGAPPEVIVDGIPQADGRMPLLDDGRDHTATVAWSPPPSPGV